MAGLVLLALAAAAASLIQSATAPRTNEPAPVPAEYLPASEHGDAGPLLAEYDCEDAGAWATERPGAIPATVILTYPGVFEPVAVPFAVGFEQASAGLAEETLYLCGGAR